MCELLYSTASVRYFHCSIKNRQPSHKLACQLNVVVTNCVALQMTSLLFAVVLICYLGTLATLDIGAIFILTHGCALSLFYMHVITVQTAIAFSVLAV